VLLLLPCLLGGCGLLSRQRDAYVDLAAAGQLKDPAQRNAALATLRGAEPLIPAVWLASAQAAATPEEGLALVERGLSFLPQSPDLLVARMAVLAQLGRRDDEVAAARSAMAADAPTELRAEALWFLVDGLLAKGLAGEAEAEVVRMRGLPFSRPEMAATTWARVALAHELAGHGADADRTLDASLDLGAAGLMGLRRASLVSSDSQAGAHALVERALARQPEHPDLQLYLLVDRMTAGDIAGAAAALEQLPPELPDRLVSQREALHARILLLQGQTEAGLDVLRARLDEEPGDAFALGVLLEAWHVRHVPEAAEMTHWLRAARRRVWDPALAAEIQATLLQLEQQAPAAAPEPRP